MGGKKKNPERTTSTDCSGNSFAKIAMIGDVVSVKRIIASSSFDVGEKFEHNVGVSGLKETRTILDEALDIDQVMGSSLYVPLLIKNTTTNFSSTVNLVGWSTLQRVLLHSLVAQDFFLFQSFCARLKDSDLEDRHCHHCGKVSDQLLHRCGICRIAVYCDENCQKSDWKSGPLYANGMCVSHKMLHAEMSKLVLFSEWYNILENKRMEQPQCK